MIGRAKRPERKTCYDAVGTSGTKSVTSTKHRNLDQSKRIAFIVLAGSLFMFSAISKLLLGKQPQTGVVSAMSSSSSSPALTKHRVLCFGDSLTAGTCPPGYENFPYAPHLEAKLDNVLVRHIGYPGWTSKQLLEDADGEAGLRTIIRRNKDTPLLVVIILAGTNDLGFQRSVPDIFESVTALHKLCYEENVPNTVVVEIPSSGYSSLHKAAAERAGQVNALLKEFCESESRATYAPFPFGWEQGDKRWASDGLHFSSEGYKELGESLAPVIETIINTK